MKEYQGFEDNVSLLEKRAHLRRELRERQEELPAPQMFPEGRYQEFLKEFPAITGRLRSG
jgi:hypothetical protein